MASPKGRSQPSERSLDHSTQVAVKALTLNLVTRFVYRLDGSIDYIQWAYEDDYAYWRHLACNAIDALRRLELHESGKVVLS